MKGKAFEKQSGPFLHWLARWKDGLGTKSADEIFGEPHRAAVMSVDMVVGFCSDGPLASPRVAGIVSSVKGLFERAHKAGVMHFLLFQDRHEADALEFEAFGPHCIAGTAESETIPELANLPFSNLFRVIPKNSLSSAVGTTLDSWIDSQGEVDRFIVVGDCTDLCVYQLVMHLRIAANVSGLKRTVIVPADCVDTYDVPVDRASESGILPHDGELLHHLFLYHMALNGIDVVAGIR